jgi:hypothetical protein
MQCARAMGRLGSVVPSKEMWYARWDGAEMGNRDHQTRELSLGCWLAAGVASDSPEA